MAYSVHRQGGPFFMRISSTQVAAVGWGFGTVSPPRSKKLLAKLSERMAQEAPGGNAVQAGARSWGVLGLNFWRVWL